MTVYAVRGVRLDIPDGRVNDRLARALQSGRYEGSEAEALLRHMGPGDRLVDLGAGAGFLCCLAAARLGAAAVAGIEPDPDMVDVARNNLTRNGHADCQIVHAAVVSDGFAAPTAHLRRGAAFWSSRLAARGVGQGTVTVPTVRLGDLLERLCPTILTCDIEGGELDLFEGGVSPEVRLIVMELHPVRYGPRGTRRVFGALARAGFAYCPEGSRGATIVMTRA